MSEKYISPDIFLLEHFQEPHDRHSYLRGLAVDCYLNLGGIGSDRNSHYFARECWWNQRPKTALKEFKRHINFNAWPAERAESMMFCGDIYGVLNDARMQALSYSEAYYVESGRNTALIKLAQFYLHNRNYKAAIAYAKAAADYEYSGFYADDPANYKQRPHEILYQAMGYLGRVEEAQTHLLKALEFQPYNHSLLDATKFFFPYHDHAEIQGWMRFPEQLFLFELGKKYNKIAEVGSFKGKSTHALCSGNKEGTVYAIDTWEGSKDERDDTHWLSKVEDVYSVFLENTKEFKNLIPIRKSSVDAAKDFEDKSLDAVFIDAGHLASEVREDILAWLPKLKDDGMICGHDFQKDVWMTVVEGVESVFGKVDGTCDSIWFVDFRNSKWHGSKNVLCDLIKVQPPSTTIPKKVYTAWFGEPMPELVQKCIESQRKMCQDFGYEHTLFTLENLPSQVGYLQYLKDAINSPHPAGVKYCKATDYLRMKILYWFGGIFIDSDFEILPGKNFDAMLNDQMFVGLEVADWANGKVVLGTAVVGAIPNHPMIKEWMETVERDFRGDDNLNYESSMDLLNKIGVKYQDKMHLYNPDFFYPYEWLHSGQTNITENTIGIHHFMRTWIPETNKKSTLQQFKYNIENNINFTFVKRGDGELACMNGESGGNCDGHPYSKELGDKLREAYEYFEVRKSTIIVEFDDQVSYNVLLHRTDSNLKEVSDFYKAIATSNRPKYFVGPERLRPVSEYLKAKHIVIPETNWWSKYDEIMKYMPLEPAAIYLFCAGMPAKVLMHDIMKYEYASPPGTYLDCGSAFDPSVYQSRTWQISKDEFWNLYNYKVKEVVTVHYPKEEPVNNFLLPQETHPERLWAIDNIK